MENKKTFEKPELIIYYFVSELDTLTASGGNYDPLDPEKDYWDD